MTGAAPAEKGIAIVVRSAFELLCAARRVADSIDVVFVAARHIGLCGATP